MSFVGWFSIAAYAAILVAVSYPLGLWMARVYEGRRCGLDVVLGPVERLVYRFCGVDPRAEMSWKAYALAALVFNAFGLLVVYALQRLQGSLPLNPDGLGPVSTWSSWNTAVSFATNTNWQGYAGESTMSHLTQMLGLAVQNFLSAATGMAALVALIRGLVRTSATGVGNFWRDLVRSTLYILLPLSLVLAVLLVSQGVVQSFDPAVRAELIEPTVGADGAAVTTQTIPLGPAASQIAIKQLGTNGGGYFNVNSSHPLENPTPFSNLLQCLAILLIPAGLCFTFGRMIGRPREGWMLFGAMLFVLLVSAAATASAEAGGTPALAAAGVDLAGGDANPGGNMEGKEVRHGVAASATWAVATTAASNGSVNSMHDSYTPLGGLVPMVLIQLGEVIFGGVGSGLYGMLVFAIIAVFLAGLMIGRTPCYLGKKIEAFEMKMASLAVLAPCAAVLIGTAVAAATQAGRRTMANPGAHGFSEVLYAFSSAGNNNGSAFAGLGADNPFYNTALGLAMLIGRYFPMVAALAIAGSLAAKRETPTSAGTLRTDTFLFGGLLVAVVLVVGALTFFPALALGPVAEHFEAGR